MCLANAGVQRKAFPAALDHVLRKDGLRPADPQPSGDLGGGEAVGNRNGDTTGPDDSQIDGHRRGRHRHIDGHRIARFQTHPLQASGHAIGQFLQLSVGPLADCAIRSAKTNGHGIARRLKTAIGDIERCTHEPLWTLGRRLFIEHAGVGRAKADAQAADHHVPEPGPLVDRPLVQLPIRGELKLGEQRRDVRAAQQVVGRKPCRPRASRRWPCAKYEPVHTGINAWRQIRPQQGLEDRRPAPLGRWTGQGVDSAGQLFGIGRRQAASGQLGSRKSFGRWRVKSTWVF